MSNIPVQGYPMPIGGSKTKMIFDHYGPKSYVQYNASTGAGDVINASDLGFGGIDANHILWTGYSDDGNYLVQLMLTKADDWPTGSTSSGAGGSAGTRLTAQWFTTSAAFGAKSTEANAATDLSARFVRCDFIMC